MSPPMNLDRGLLAFWRLTERFEGIPPPVREFGEECGIESTSHGHYWLTRLVAEGLIYTPKALLGGSGSRTLQLTNAGRSTAEQMASRLGRVEPSVAASRSA